MDTSFLKEVPREDLERALVTFSTIQSRSEMASRLGKQFSGERNLYAELGYKTKLVFKDYEAMYDRSEMAAAIVDVKPEDTWRNVPQILDGGEEETEFTKEITALADKMRLWHYFGRVDRLAGIGQYGLLVIGVEGAEKLDDEVKEGSVKKEDGVIFLATYDEGSATVERLVGDVGDPRFGLPEIYELEFGEIEGKGSSSKKVMVHWSRVIHVAEGLLEDEVYGEPRLKKVYNRLMDIEKVVGGGSEAIWRLIYKGMVLTTQEGYEYDEDGLDEDKIDEFVHGMRRVLELEGYDVSFEGGEVVDPTGMVDILISLIAAKVKIPKRMLMGSERGELASTMDQETWAGVINARQTQFAEPVILRPFIDRLVTFGALPTPSEDGYEVIWQPTYTMSETEKVDLADKAADAISKIAPLGQADLIIDPKLFIEAYLPKLTDAVVSEEALLEREEKELAEAEEARKAAEAAESGETGEEAEIGEEA